MTKNKVIKSNSKAYPKDRVIFAKHDPFSKDRIAAPVSAIIVFVFCTLHLTSGLLTLASAVYDYKSLNSKTDFYTISNSLFVSIVGSLCFLLHTQSFFISAVLVTAASIYKRKISRTFKPKNEPYKNIAEIKDSNVLFYIHPNTPSHDINRNYRRNNSDEELASNFTLTCL